jgi:hypothetical protein
VTLQIQALEHSRRVTAMLRMDNPPKQIMTVLIALVIGHIRSAEEHLLAHPSTLGGNRWRTAILALAAARRELEQGREALNWLDEAPAVRV